MTDPSKLSIWFKRLAPLLLLTGILALGCLGPNRKPVPEKLSLSLPGQQETVDIDQQLAYRLSCSPREAEEGGLQYRSSDAEIVSFQKNRLQTHRTGRAQIFVTSLDGTVVSNKITLTVMDFSLEAEKIEQLIDQISAPDMEQVLTARAAYQQLPEPVQALVQNLTKLEQYELQLQTTSQQPSDWQQQHNIVYVTESGTRYHLNSHCGSGSYAPVSLEEALDRGLTPCKRCAGG